MCLFVELKLTLNKPSHSTSPLKPNQHNRGQLSERYDTLTVTKVVHLIFEKLPDI